MAESEVAEKPGPIERVRGAFRNFSGDVGEHWPRYALSGLAVIAILAIIVGNRHPIRFTLWFWNIDFPGCFWYVLFFGLGFALDMFVSRRYSRPTPPSRSGH